jgi:hypothetical protein
MMVRPKSYVPTETQPWARSVASDLSSLDTAITILREGNYNAFKVINSTIGNLSMQVARIQETNTLTASPQAVPYNTAGTEYTVVKPSWANYALLNSGASLVSKTINGDVRIELMHASSSITAFADYCYTLNIGAGAAAGDFVPQSFPFLVDMSDASTLYTRPWSIPLGASTGSVTVLFTTNVQWLQV